MALGLGEMSWIGLGEESVWGTLVARTKFIEIISENIKAEHPKTARSTLSGPSRKYYRKGKQAVGGDVVGELGYEGWELLFKHLFGSVASAQQAATAAYKHTFSLADSPPIGLSVEVNRGDVSGFFYAGCQVSELKLSQETDGELQSTWGLIGKAETTGAKSSPTFPTDRPVEWFQLTTATIGGVTFDPVSLEITFANALADDRYKLGDRARRGIGRGGVRAVSGSLTAEFDSLTPYNYFVNEDEKALVLTWQGALIETPYNHELTLTLPVVTFTGETPEVSGEGPMELSLPFEAWYDVSGSQDEIKAELTNTLTSV